MLVLRTKAFPGVQYRLSNHPPRKNINSRARLVRVPTQTEATVPICAFRDISVCNHAIEIDARFCHGLTICHKLKLDQQSILVDHSVDELNSSIVVVEAVLIWYFRRRV